MSRVKECSASGTLVAGIVRSIVTRASTDAARLDRIMWMKLYAAAPSRQSAVSRPDLFRVMKQAIPADAEGILRDADIDDERPTFDVGPGQEAPIAAVVRFVAVVTHHPE